MKKSEGMFEPLEPKKLSDLDELAVQEGGKFHKWAKENNVPVVSLLLHQSRASSSFLITNLKTDKDFSELIANLNTLVKNVSSNYYCICTNPEYKKE